MNLIRLLCLWLCCLPAFAGTLAQADLARRFPPPLQVGARDASLPVWPIFKQNGTATELVGYVFESADFAAIPGFAGVPMNMLVAIDPQGVFIDVAVLSHHEPVFLDGLGEAPLFAFARQYKGLSLRQNIHIDSKAGRAGDAAHAYLDGVSKATASVRILHQSVLAGALRVARAKLGFAQGRDPDRIARIDMAKVQSLSVGQMRDAGLLVHLRVLNRDVETLFKGSDGAALDAQALERPGDVFIDLYLAWVSVPAVGGSLLAPASWDRLRARLDEGDHAMLVMSRGRYSIIADDFVRGSVTARLLLKQEGLPLDMRDLDMPMRLADGVDLPADSVTVLRIIGQAGLDPARPLDFTLPITREKGMIYPERITRDLALRYRLAPAYYLTPQPGSRSWHAVWAGRTGDIAVLAAALALLAAVLALQQRLARYGRAAILLRAGFLLFTIAFIGYYAQAQLSIVNLTGVLQALLAGRGLAYLMFDPMTLVLWGFVLVSLLAWGRGAFCGWLCPFGALQECTAWLGRLLRMPQLRLRTAADARLKLFKYLVLLAILASAIVAPSATDSMVEIEPFKTAITLNFVRAWPYVAFAAGLLALSMVSFKFFCRYVCPLGAALALLGRFRLADSIARRKACGTPCQTCRHRCDYQAIKPSGAIAYEECFQCLDCSVIHESDQQCAPLMLEIKRARTIPIARSDAH